jgi:hypothetical protein
MSRNKEEMTQLRAALEKMSIDNLRLQATLQLRTSEAHRCGQKLEHQSSCTQILREVIRECQTDLRNVEQKLRLGLMQNEEHESPKRVCSTNLQAELAV